MGENARVLEIIVTAACVLTFVVALVGWARLAFRERSLRLIRTAARHGRWQAVLAFDPPREAGRADALVLQATAALRLGDAGRAEPLVDEAVRLGGLPASALRVARHVKAQVLDRTCRFGELAAFLAEHPDDPSLDPLRLTAASMVGDLDLAERLLEADTRPGREAQRLVTLAGVRLRQERYDEADALYVAALEQVDGSGRAQVTGSRALTALRRGDIDGAAELIEESLATFATAGDDFMHVWAELVAAETNARRGDVPAARSHFDRAVALHGSSTHGVVQARFPVAAAEIAWAAGESERARAQLNDAVTVHERMGIRLEVERLQQGLTEFADPA